MLLPLTKFSVLFVDFLIIMNNLLVDLLNVFLMVCVIDLFYVFTAFVFTKGDIYPRVDCKLCSKQYILLCIYFFIDLGESSAI